MADVSVIRCFLPSRMSGRVVPSKKNGVVVLPGDMPVPPATATGLKLKSLQNLHKYFKTTSRSKNTLKITRASVIGLTYREVFSK